MTSYHTSPNFRYFLRKAYYNLSAAHIFHRPADMGWRTASGARGANIPQEIAAMLDSKFRVVLDSGAELAAFDGLGYAAVTGNVYVNATAGQLTTTSDPEFVVSRAGETVARLDEIGLYLKGGLYEERTDLDGVIGSGCFRVKDRAGQTVALINGQSFASISTDANAIPAGSLILKERLIARNHVH